MSNDEIGEAFSAGLLRALTENPNWVRDRGPSPQEATRDDGSDWDAFKADPKAFIRQAVSEPVKPRQLTRDDLAGMSYEDINAAREAGQLRDLLGY